mgnify:CR=1 FL=1
MRLADLENVRLEMKWQHLANNNDLLGMVVEHAKKIGWENNKINKLNQSGNAFSLENRSADIHQQILFLKSTNAKARLAVLRLFYQSNENGDKLATEIVNSFQDNLFAEQSLWTYYNCALKIPSVYKKVKSDINAGNKGMTFA